MAAVAVNTALKLDFRRQLEGGASSADVEALARALKAGGRKAGSELTLAAAFAHAAYAAPWRIADIFDAAARGWLDQPFVAAPVETAEREALAPAEGFWRDFWGLIGATGLDAGAVTLGTAALGVQLHPGILAASAEASSAFPSVLEAAEAGFPARWELADIAACPSGSLGEALYRLIVDNQFDLEVLDRDALRLRDLIAPLDYLNARMLQAHDLWHLVAGYHTTALHEVAISGFQLAQFGHGYSAMFLAMVATTAAVRDPAFFAMLMDTILTGWVHGRRTPPMLLIPWEAVWDEPVETVRARYGVTPYESPYPADIFERLSAAQAAAA